MLMRETEGCIRQGSGEQQALARADPRKVVAQGRPSFEGRSPFEDRVGVGDPERAQLGHKEIDAVETLRGCHVVRHHLGPAGQDLIKLP